MQVSILVVYPNTLYPAFKILEFHLFKKVRRNSVKYFLENLLRTTIVVSTVVVGVYSINRFDTLLALAGCSIMTPISLILPPLFHYKLFKTKQSSFRNFLDIFVTLIGCSLSITILIFTLI
jgi:amino acid permease